MKKKVTRNYFHTSAIQINLRLHYLDNIEEREEGGTPAIVESIRAGLVFQLKEVIRFQLI